MNKNRSDLLSSFTPEFSRVAGNGHSCRICLFLKLLKDFREWFNLLIQKEFFWGG